MSDGSGVVNLNGINLKANNDPKWAVEDPSYYWTYSYNPCKGFSFSYDRYNDDGTTTQVNYADLAVSLYKIIVFIISVISVRCCNVIISCWYSKI